MPPGIEALRRPLADQACASLRAVDGFGDCGLLCPHMGEWLCLGLGTLGLAPQYQPGGPARCQRWARRLGHNWQGSARAAAPGGRALGLPPSAGIGGDHPIAARLATLAEGAKQPHGVIAPRIPALEERRLRGGAATLPAVAATSAPCKGGGPESALHRA